MSPPALQDALQIRLLRISSTRRAGMLQRMCAVAALAALSVLVGQAPAAEADLTAGLKKETVELKSAGPLAFGPQGILFIGDPLAATIYAVDTGDRIAPKSNDRPNVEGVDAKIASMLGV